MVRKIGEGGCGEVYLAEQTSLGRHAVVKLMHPELSRDPSYVARFRREAQLAAKLSHHHTAAIYAFGETPERVLWIAMEYIEGESLHGPLARESARDLAELLSPIADVLDRAAALGIIHRDVKPDNILVSPESGGGRRAVLLDFGLARPMEDTDKLTAVGVAVGSPTYMSPEQVFGPTVDSATDRYAFGVILYMAVAKRPPFRHDDRVQLVLMHKRAPVPPLHTILPSFPPNHPLDQFFAKALAKQPGDRFASARQMIQEFIAALEEAPAGASTRSMPSKGPLPARPPPLPGTSPPSQPGGGGLTSRPSTKPPMDPPAAAGSSPVAKSASSGDAHAARPGLPVVPSSSGATGWEGPSLPASDKRPDWLQATLPALGSQPVPPTPRPPAVSRAPLRANEMQPLEFPGQRTDPMLQPPVEEVTVPTPPLIQVEAGGEEESQPLPGHPRLYAEVAGSGRQIDILCGSEALMGKHRDCELVCRAFPSPEQDAITHGVSRQHARLRVASGKLYLEDLGSLNGTFLDSERLGPGAVLVPDGARIRLGPVLTIEVQLFKSGAALLRRVDPYRGSQPPTLLLWDRLALGEPALGLVPPTGDAVTRWGVLHCSRPRGELWWGGPRTVIWRRGDRSPSRPQPVQPGDRFLLNDVEIVWRAGVKPGLQ
ncbi:MAG: protein kinase [Myxococcales bacterium]|nr:protein kinase [Myxococcales bacterium]